MRASMKGTESLVCRMKDKASFVGRMVVLATVGGSRYCSSEILQEECQDPKSMKSKRKILCVWLG